MIIKSKMKIDEAEYRTLNKLDNTNNAYEMKIDFANQIIDDIQDNIYNLSNKLESIQKIAKSLHLDIDDDIDAVINSIYAIFESGDAWYHICEQFEKLN